MTVPKLWFLKSAIKKDDWIFKGLVFYNPITFTFNIGKFHSVVYPVDQLRDPTKLHMFFYG